MQDSVQTPCFNANKVFDEDATKLNTAKRCSTCPKKRFWYVFEVDNMPTSQHTRKLRGWEASEDIMLLLVRATLCFLGLTFQPFPPSKYACKKERARSKKMNMLLRGYGLPLPCRPALPRCACCTYSIIDIWISLMRYPMQTQFFFYFTNINTAKRDF